MKRPILALLLAVVTAVGCGQRGKTGAQGDTGPQGPPGPISDPPHITSITPEYGSSRTIFTIHGDHFGATAADDTIYVADEAGAKLQVISASTTEIKITGAFEPVLEQTAMPISLQVANQVSNPILIQAMPTGSTRDAGLAERLYAYPNQIVASATTLYVLDGTRGVFAHDLASGEITPVALPGQNGIQHPQQVYLAQDGTLMLVDVDGSNFQRLLARQADGSWNVTLRFGGSVAPPIAMGFGSTGDMLIASTGRIQYVKADGTLGWSSTPSAGYTPAAVTSIGAKFYVTFRYNGGAWANIDAFDVFGNQVLLNPSVTFPTLLTTDGADLYVQDQSTFKRVDPTNGATTTVGGSPGHTITSIASGSAGRLFSADTSCDVIFRIGATANTMASIALDAAQQISAGGAGDLLAATVPFYDGTRNVSALYEIPAKGAVRLVDLTHNYSWLQHEGATALFVDGLAHTVNQIDLGTGTVTLLAGSAEGLVNPTGVTKGADGTIYVVDQPTSGTTSVATIAGGTVHAGFATASVPLYGAMVSGNELFLGGGNGVYGVPLTGGAITLLTMGPNAPWFGFNPWTVNGGFAPDGAGGVFLVDWTTNNGAVVDVAVDGTIRVLSPMADPVLRAMDVTVDPASGNLRVFGVYDETRPVLEMFP